MSLQEPILRRSDSRASIVSMNSAISQDVEHFNNKIVDHYPGGRAGSMHRNHRGILKLKSYKMNKFLFASDSPADLHGMWYPTVRRTLVCLSRLYRCIDRPIFQSLSQEALSFCIQSVSSAAQLITTNKVTLSQHEQNMSAYLF